MREGEGEKALPTPLESCATETQLSWLLLCKINCAVLQFELFLSRMLLSSYSLCVESAIQQTRVRTWDAFDLYISRSHSAHEAVGNTPRDQLASPSSRRTAGLQSPHGPQAQHTSTEAVHGSVRGAKETVPTSPQASGFQTPSTFSPPAALHPLINDSPYSARRKGSAHACFIASCAMAACATLPSSLILSISASREGKLASGRMYPQTSSLHAWESVTETNGEVTCTQCTPAAH